MPLRDVRGALQIIDRTITDLFNQQRQQGADREAIEQRINQLKQLRSRILAKAVDTIEEQFEAEETE